VIPALISGQAIGRRIKRRHSGTRGLIENLILEKHKLNLPAGIGLFTPRFRKSKVAMKLVVYLYLSMIVLGVQVSVGLRLITSIYYFAILIFLIFLARKNFFYMSIYYYLLTRRVIFKIC